jgi:hypothetical protein
MRGAIPRGRADSRWSERWHAPETRIAAIEGALAEHGCVVARGGPYDRWDLQVSGGTLGAARLLVMTEEHGRGRQLTRFRVRTAWARGALISVASLLGASIGAVLTGAPAAAAVLGGGGLLLLAGAARQCGAACRAISSAIDAAEEPDDPPPSPRPVVRLAAPERIHG